MVVITTWFILGCIDWLLGPGQCKICQTAIAQVDEFLSPVGTRRTAGPAGGWGAPSLYLSNTSWRQNEVDFPFKPLIGCRKGCEPILEQSDKGTCIFSARSMVVKLKPFFFFFSLLINCQLRQFSTVLHQVQTLGFKMNKCFSLCQTQNWCNPILVQSLKITGDWRTVSKHHCSEESEFQF